jgi:transposase-like protein
MSKAKKARVGKRCPRCTSTVTRQLTNYGIPIKGRFQCFDCKRTWDEVNVDAPDYIKEDK